MKMTLRYGYLAVSITAFSVSLFLVIQLFSIYWLSLLEKTILFLSYSLIFLVGLRYLIEFKLRRGKQERK
jgi:hypothetical protein